MKIVTASKFYYHRAGLEAYLFKITEALRARGHDIIPFSTIYKDNIQTEYDKYFAEYIDIGGSERITHIQKLKAFLRIMYNFDAKTKFGALLDDTNPDLVWGFGVHRHLSPSIFIEAKKRSIPVVHRLSDYAIICPNSRLKRSDGSVCSELLCPLQGYHNALKYKCVTRSNSDLSPKVPSISASFVGALELYLHNKFNAYRNNVDKFIAPSNFLRNVMIKTGISPEKIVHIPIFIDASKYEPNYQSFPYFLFFGRLTEEKGLKVLLEAMSNLKMHRLVIVGDGPERASLEEYIKAKNLLNVRILGDRRGNDLKRLIKNSRFVVVPSTWFDNSPNVILEAYAQGKPVLATNIGGIPEYIEENSTGMLFDLNNIDDLQEKIDFLMNQPNLCEEMGKCARHTVVQKYNPEKHYESVSNLLHNIVN